MFFEFSQFQIEQVLNNCHHLFTVAGVLEHILRFGDKYMHRMFVLHSMKPLVTWMMISIRFYVVRGRISGMRNC